MMKCDLSWQISKDMSSIWAVLILHLPITKRCDQAVPISARLPTWVCLRNWHEKSQLKLGRKTEKKQ